jgi:hypothetical protein
MYPSITAAVSHLLHYHKDEVQARAADCKKKQENSPKTKSKRCDSHRDLVEPKSMPSVAQLMVFEFMGRYEQQFNLP